MAELVPGGALSAVVLDWRDQTSLSGTAEPILRLSVSVQPPSSGCADPCELSLVDGLRGEGEALDTLAIVEGRAYEPARARGAVEVCAP